MTASSISAVCCPDAERFHDEGRHVVLRLTPGEPVEVHEAQPTGVVHQPLPEVRCSVRGHQVGAAPSRSWTRASASPAVRSPGASAGAAAAARAIAALGAGQLGGASTLAAGSSGADASSPSDAPT